MNIPDNANEGCPGTEHDNAGNEDACKGCPNKKICQNQDPEEKVK